MFLINLYVRNLYFEVLCLIEALLCTFKVIMLPNNHQLGFRRKKKGCQNRYLLDLCKSIQLNK